MADDYLVSESHLSCFVFPLECYFQDADIWDVRGLSAFEDGALLVTWSRVKTVTDCGN